MTRVLLYIAALGLTVSGAGACEYLKSVKAEVDQTTVASVATDKTKVMTTATDTEAVPTTQQSTE